LRGCADLEVGGLDLHLSGENGSSKVISSIECSRVRALDWLRGRLIIIGDNSETFPSFIVDGVVKTYAIDGNLCTADALAVHVCVENTDGSSTCATLGNLHAIRGTSVDVVFRVHESFGS
jgi:hypothetical protein